MAQFHLIMWAESAQGSTSSRSIAEDLDAGDVTRPGLVRIGDGFSLIRSRQAWPGGQTNELVFDCFLTGGTPGSP